MLPWQLAKIYIFSFSFLLFQVTFIIIIIGLDLANNSNPGLDYRE